MTRLLLAILALGLLLAGGRAHAQATGAHSLTVKVDQVDRIETVDPPPKDVVVQAGSDKTVETTLGLETNAPPSDPRKVVASVAEALPKGITLEVKIVNETNYVQLGTASQTLLTDFSSASTEKTLEYRVTVRPNVKVSETTAEVTYTLQAE